MSTLVLYYSWSGTTRTLAAQAAAEAGADLCEVVPVKKRGTLRVFVAGCFASLRGKAWPIRPLERDMAAYDRLILMAPVWAGNPAPPAYAVLEQLPSAKDVEVRLVSSGGESAAQDRIRGMIDRRGSRMTAYTDIKAPAKPA